MTEPSSSSEQRTVGYSPPDPIGVAPLFVWPPQPKALLRFIFGYPGYLRPFFAFFVAAALVTWLLLSPNETTVSTLKAGWIIYITVRNALLITIVSGTLYYLLYVRRRQGTQYKYNPNWPAKNNARFLFKDQVWENVFWNYFSAVPIWSAYEVLGRWLHANNYAPTVTWSAHPVYCATLVLLMWLYVQMHFWAVHRLLHWPPLYRAAHYLHHKNTNPNTWSGLSMHPIEHLLFFSGAALFYVLPSHPFHLVLYLNALALSTAMDHSFFHKIVLPGNRDVPFDAYMHYLHHKYFEVNYAGDTTFPIDVWQDTFHNGTQKGQEVLKRRRRRASASARAGAD